MPRIIDPTAIRYMNLPTPGTGEPRFYMFFYWVLPPGKYVRDFTDEGVVYHNERVLDLSNETRPTYYSELVDVIPIPPPCHWPRLRREE